MIRVYGKGAPDYLLTTCTHMLGQDGSSIELTQDKRDHIMKDVIKEKFAKKAYRTLLIAYKDFSLHEFEDL